MPGVPQECEWSHWHCNLTKDQNQFLKILAALDLLTPECFLSNLGTLNRNNEGKINFGSFLAGNEVSAKLYSLLTWDGKMAAANVLKTVVANEE